MQIKELIKKSINYSSHLIFPKICLHCKEEVLMNNYFCPTCVDHLEFIEPSSLSFDLNEKKIPLVVTFDEMGPAKTLLLEVNRESTGLLKLAASFMVCQYLNLNSQMPDFVVPIQQGKGKHVEILTKEIAKILNRPMFKLFCTAKVAFWQEAFFLKKTCLQNKKILLITDKLDRNEEKAVSLLLKEGFIDLSILALCQK